MGGILSVLFVTNIVFSRCSASSRFREGVPDLAARCTLDRNGAAREEQEFSIRGMVTACVWGTVGSLLIDG
jgi:hypothetical protein